MADEFDDLLDNMQAAGAEHSPPQGETLTCVMPIPADATPISMSHPTLSEPVKSWTYCDTAGGILGYVGRYETPKGKEIRVRTLWKDSGGALTWQWKHWPNPKPLYGLNLLHHDPPWPILIVEGEKSADAARILMPRFDVVTWPGGAKGVYKADWSLIPMGRDILLWADNDEPGVKAMQDVAAALRKLGHTEITVVNLDVLSKSFNLEKGDDAADLVDRGVTPEQMAESLEATDSFLDAPEPASSASAKGSADYDPESDQAEMNNDFIAFIARKGWSVNASGQWLVAGKASDLNLPVIAEEFSVDRRLRSLQAPNRMIRETISVQMRMLQKERRASILENLFGKPATAEGLELLIQWVTLITGTAIPLHVAVIAHFIWNVKRSLAGLPFAHDLMPVLFGKAHGDGKSTAIRLLTGPFQELAVPINVDVLTDSRRARELYYYVIGKWDEMEGANRGDIESLKNKLTSDNVSYRPMATNDSVVLPRHMSFIGTSNKPVAQMIRDTTGARRFFQLDVPGKLDWEALNGLDYMMLWTAVNETNPSPITPFLGEMKLAQEEFRGQDSVSLWLEQETWAFLIPPRDEPRIDAYNHKSGDSGDTLRERYRHWCARTGEHPVGGNIFFDRLDQEGFRKHRTTTGRRMRVWFLPDRLVPTPAPEYSLAVLMAETERWLADLNSDAMLRAAVGAKTPGAQAAGQAAAAQGEPAAEPVGDKGAAVPPEPPAPGTEAARQKGAPSSTDPTGLGGSQTP